VFQRRGRPLLTTKPPPRRALIRTRDDPSSARVPRREQRARATLRDAQRSSVKMSFTGGGRFSAGPLDFSTLRTLLAIDGLSTTDDKPRAAEARQRIDRPPDRFTARDVSPLSNSSS